MRFRAVPADECVWACWGDESVVYHRPAGKTHFLNAGTVLLLQHVLRDPKDAATAARELAGLQGAVADQRFHEHIADLLQRLDDLGLVERSPL